MVTYAGCVQFSETATTAGVWHGRLLRYDPDTRQADVRWSRQETGAPAQEIEVTVSDDFIWDCQRPVGREPRRAGMDVDTAEEKDG